MFRIGQYVANPEHERGLVMGYATLGDYEYLPITPKEAKGMFVYFLRVLAAAGYQYWAAHECRKAQP